MIVEMQTFDIVCYIKYYVLLRIFARAADERTTLACKL